MKNIERIASAKTASAISILIVVVAILIIGFIAVWAGYNRAIALEEKVKSSWAQVENQLTRRFDLIPNLVETVKGYAKHEQELLRYLADTKAKYFAAGSVREKVNIASEFESALSRLLFLQERFPELKANENFLKLQDQLEGTENRIAVERKRYNEAVRELNTYCRSFFGRFFCKLAGVQQAEYFNAPEAKKELPKVEF